MPLRDSVSWAGMFQAFARCGHLEAAKETFYQVPCKDVVTWNLLLAAFLHNDCRIQEARCVFERMPKRSLISWNSLLATYARTGNVCEAKRLFDRMPGRDVFSWTTMVGGFAEKADVTEARRFFARMPKQNVVSWNTMVATNSQGGHLAEAERLFEEMPERNFYSWSVMLAAYAHLGHTEEAIRVFHEMEVDGVRPDEVAFMCLLAACGHRGMVAEALGYFASMVSDYGLEPTAEHYSSIVASFARSGQLKHAEELLASMPFLPDQVAWRVFLGACGTLEDVSRAQAAARRVSDLVPANSVPYVVLANTYRAGLGSFPEPS
ncbi:hypothetical protein SELMODRAFT_97596 [Selaginella moellendorffii]|uniref:Pentacotripeptide-repeat region of PRORP domain-containing protein n=2 Tax=Selaginella moellendorffii TaxID=88036 RepID=D8RMZ8_SELML|nr:hypothetical protein SELMODRAFT_97596 [Selaginella moellendorffii]